ncbi:hypothetical protein RND81_07G184400 [Saponaria officinalis]|uniref:F-box protein n=1 Tax=Saponaria officinalis TaxID=3572 RepID=A0AAW1JPV9_SAPOF
MDPNLIISSGCERGLWSDMSFDFSPIRICNPTSTETNGYFFTIDGGLLLVTFKDGTRQVHNPATKQVIMVPKSKLVEKYNLYYHRPEEVTGIIVNLRSEFFGHCRFLVIRLCRQKKKMEVYHSSSRSWSMHTIRLDELQLFDVKWSTNNYVVLPKQKALGFSLFLLAINRGIAIKSNNTRNKYYGFPLPKDVPVYGSNPDNIRISGCKNVLHLFYHNNTGLWIWKAGSTKVDKWTWIPVLVISNNCTRLCKPVGRKHLTKLVLNPIARVIPLCCHPSDRIVFLLVKSSIFAYHLKKDTMERIVDMNDEDSLNISLILPFQPCLSNLYYKLGS